MTSINTLSGEPKFTIKTVSDLTGVLPVTLRAWERRYGILSPGRKDNSYRLYSDRDVAIIRWLKSKLAAGISISTAASNLLSMAKNNEWPEILPVGISQTPVPNFIPPERFSEELFTLLTQHNEADAAKLYQQILSTYDLDTVLLGIITPCLNVIGEAWFRGELNISTEHFASAFILSRLNILYQSYPVATSGPNTLIGGAPGDEHEMGALMMAILLRSRGYRVEFLGPNLHIDDLVDYAKTSLPAVVILTASNSYTAMELTRVQAKLNSINNPPHFCYAGLAFDLDPDLRSKIPGIYLGSSMIAALDQIKQLLTT